MTVNEPTLEGALHVVPGPSAAGSLKHCGCRDMVVMDQPLFPGPCDTNAKRHFEKRKAYFHSFTEYYGPDADTYLSYWNWMAENGLSAGELVRRLIRVERRPIVIWTSPEFSERLQFWWVLDTIYGSGLELNNCWVVEPQLRTRSEFPYPPRVGGFAPEQLRRVFGRRRRLNRPWIKTGVTLWKSYAGNSPRVFDRACRKTHAMAPNLEKDTRIYLAFFPQIGMEKSSQLRLSEFDQSLLDGLHTEKWLRPIDLLKANHELINFMVSGDYVVTHRLRSWISHSSDRPAIVKRKEGKGDNDWTSFSCRLTVHGKRLREYGLETVAEGPAMELGGCSVYTEKPTWVRRTSGKRSWIDVVR